MSHSLLDTLQAILPPATDVVYHPLTVGRLTATPAEAFRHMQPGMPATLLYIDGLVNYDQINNCILKPLSFADTFDSLTPKAVLEAVANGAIYQATCKRQTDAAEIIQNVLMGNCALVLEGVEQAAVFDVKGFDKRAVTAPSDENIVRGAKDCFIEVLRTNTALMRRKLPSADLQIEHIPIGTELPIQTAMLYLKGTAEPEMVERIRARLQAIPATVLKAPGTIEAYITDHRYSPFPQTITTERPDKLSACVTEGKIGLLVDGYPFAYILPVTLDMFFQSSEDYTQNYVMVTIIRLIRYAGGFISLILPAFYLSITLFHQEMIPTNLMLSIINSKQAVPFDTLLEVLFMLIAFEVLVEAGVRMPKAIGQSISIIGGLVIGEAAVNAKFVSPAVVVIIAVAGICNFIIPNRDLANTLRIMRVLLVACASIAGLFGLSVGLLLMLYTMCTLTSFGIPYIGATTAPYHIPLGADGLVRMPLDKDLKKQSTPDKGEHI